MIDEIYKIPVSNRQTDLQIAGEWFQFQNAIEQLRMNIQEKK